MESCTNHPHPKAWEIPLPSPPTGQSVSPIVSKVFEMLLLTRLLPLVEHNGLIPSHQVGFRRRHSTIEHKAYCSAAFLDISQPFDKVWHIGLLYKLQQSLPINYFLFAKWAFPR
jgi:hypothetical protein